MREIAPDNLLLAAVENSVTDPNYHPEEPIMAEIFQLQPRDEWQLRFDVFKRPDGKLVAVVVDARGSLIEADIEPVAKLSNIAKMIEESVAGMRATAQAVKS